jgi:hypothetical protein
MARRVAGEMRRQDLSPSPTPAIEKTAAMLEKILRGL